MSFLDFFHLPHFFQALQAAVGEARCGTTLPSILFSLAEVTCSLNIKTEFLFFFATCGFGILESLSLKFFFG